MIKPEKNWQVRLSVLLLAGLVLFVIGLAAEAGRKAVPAARFQEELMKADRDFCAMARREGVAKAFLAFAADDVILMRDKQPPLVGRAALEAHYAKSKGGYTLTWDPDKAEAGSAGDLGYTFGHWELASRDEAGRETREYGVYVTVWKRQADGRWKYVLDGGNETPAPEKR
jgi:ketosteroid isomerase-like protein